MTRNAGRIPGGRPAVLAFLAGAALLVFAWGRCGLGGCPNVDGLTSFQPGRAPVLLDRNGKAFANLAPVEGETVPLRSLPGHVAQAFLAVEDRRFYDHEGVDWRRVLGAVLANLRARGYDEGFSTLSMQLARNVFPDRIRARERTPWRKLREIRVALEIEQKYTKDEILELYLNHIYFGNGARGVAAASRHYFGVPASKLTLGQAALLAALPKGPSLYDPRRHPKPARERRNLVLALMEEQGRLDPGQAAAARQRPLGVVRRRSSPGTPRPFAAYFVEEVRRELEERLGEGVYDDTLRIHTTLDAEAQRAAEEELERQLRAVEGGALGRFGAARYTAAAPPGDEGTDYLQGAVVSLDVRTGEVLAWVGGRDFRDSRFDRVRAGRRQAGSAFKPFVYAAALASGRTLSQHLVDEPLRVSLGGRRYWEPKNFDGSFAGQVSVREALVRSKNVPTIRLAESVGYDSVAATAQRLGLEGPISTRPSMPLGTVSVGPVELASAFTPFASLGKRATPRLVTRVEEPDGETLWEAETSEPEHVLEAGIAFLVTDALRDALERGTGTSVRALGFRGPAAGKTGTTNDGTDAWFVGYTPEVVTAVWVGFDRPRPIVTLATGGRVAAPVWARMMMRYYSRRSVPAPWRPPTGVFQAAVDPGTGHILAEGCQPLSGPAHREYFVRGMSPPSVCPYRGLPYEMMAELEIPPADDEQALELDLELPPELREPLEAEAENDDADAAAGEGSVAQAERPATPETESPPRPGEEPAGREEPAVREDEAAPGQPEGGEPLPAPFPLPRGRRAPSPAPTSTPTPAPPDDPL